MVDRSKIDPFSVVRNIEAAAFDRGDLGFASRVSADGSDKAPVDREFSSAEWVVLGEDGPIRPLRNCPTFLVLKFLQQTSYNLFLYQILCI